MNLILFSLFAVAIVLGEQTSHEDLLLQGNRQFTAKMFSEVVRAKPSESVVMSAFSVLTPLAQLSFATEGLSHDELLGAIGMPHNNATKNAFQVMKNTLQSVKGVELKTANRIYVLKGHELVEDFQNISRDLFDSDVKSVDFTSNVKTAGEINNWVEEQTNHRIKNLIQPESLNNSTRAVLANAIYFKGKWKYQFKKERTTMRDFHVSKEKTIQVPMMSPLQSHYNFASSQYLQAMLLQLPYEGDDVWMLIVLPREINGLTELQEKLKQPHILNDAFQYLSKSKVLVAIPKFRIETSIDLKQVLRNINVTRIFDENNAQLTKLLKGLDDGLYVSEAKQKAFIDVNEEGTEAGAANGFSTTRRAGPTSFYADRPFYFEIQAKAPTQSQGYITLFSGVYKG